MSQPTKRRWFRADIAFGYRYLSTHGLKPLEMLIHWPRPYGTAHQRETSASPKRASNGPNTKNEARIVFTSS